MNVRSRERLRHRTVLFGIECVFLKCCVVDAGNLGLGLQVDPGDGKRLSHFFESYLRNRVEARRCYAGARQLRRQRHREAPGVRRADQLLRVGGRLAVFKARLERVGTVKGSAADFQPPAAVGELAFPFCFRRASWHTCRLSTLFAGPLRWTYGALCPPSSLVMCGSETEA